jgi:G8 domain
MISFPSSVFSLILLVHPWGSAAEISLPSVLRGRNVQVIPPDGMKDFVPLTCNANLASAPCASWSSTFGTASSYSTRIAIPCGTCVTMDYPAADLQLNGGIDIIGKLVFPDGYKVNLQSTLIIVQGELQMTSTKQVTGVPDVRFTMIGSDATLTFTPVENNANKCKGVATCAAGKKAIVVAGGRVTRKFCFGHEHQNFR